MIEQNFASVDEQKRKYTADAFPRFDDPEQMRSFRHNAIVALIVQAKREGKPFADAALAQLSNLAGVDYRFAIDVTSHKREADIEVVSEEMSREQTGALRYVVDKLEQASAIAVKHGLVVAEDIDALVRDGQAQITESIVAGAA